VYGFNLDKRSKGKGVNGRYLPMIPPLRLFVSASQDIRFKSAVFQLLSLKAECDYNAAQNRYLAVNSTETKTPSYVLLNASATVSIRYSKRSVLQVQFHVNNLLNTAYQSNLSRLKYFEYYEDSPNGYYGIYNMGRNISARLIVPF
jgi:iron complex outermembrane receptor protein